MSMDMDTATRVFHDFAESYRPDAAAQGEMRPVTPYDVKLEHSLQVLGNARLVLEELDMGASFERLGLLAALFHDVGRFPQYHRYGTFHDPSSVDHGLLGARTLASAPQGPGLLDALPPDERSLVRAAVAMHNRRELPRGISEELRLLTELVRDADKLDIMRVMLDHFAREDLDPVITLNVASDPERFTPCVYQDVFDGLQGDYRKMRYSNDFKLLIIGWAHSLRFNASRRLLQQRRLLERLFALLPDIEAMRELQERVFLYLEEDLAKPQGLPDLRMDGREPAQ